MNKEHSRNKYNVIFSDQAEIEHYHAQQLRMKQDPSVISFDAYVARIAAGKLDRNQIAGYKHTALSKNIHFATTSEWNSICELSPNTK